MTRVKPKLMALMGLICGYHFCAGNDTLQIPQGGLRGTIKLSREGRPFSAFHAIPFAEPPVGDRRLQVSHFAMLVQSSEYPALDPILGDRYELVCFYFLFSMIRSG